MIRIFVFFILVCINVVPVYAESCPLVKRAQVIGSAYDIKTQQLLYCEYHFVNANNVVVEYRDAQQILIAKKQVDYTPSLTAPTITQKDYRHGEFVALTQQVSTIDEQTTLLLQYQAPNANKIKSKNIIFSPSLVIDAGFDNAIRANWQTLINEGSSVLTFVVTAKLAVFDLRVSQSRMKRCDKQQQYSEQDYVCFVVKSTNMVANWFIKPIKLVYERSSQRLIKFVGSVNITNDEGEPQRAVILYRYIDT